ncbi:protein TIFY 8 isoform X2 [Juglans microcarpa x Juglans regia]|uniref:protein TIFY 8 isoform X2 n=1 Tax=Juglans microcarpa x Juglans regia TaxID=2249226 RepID=UPI001B7E0C78|nr:protein TIFY 8 isoform X2 [Juglans microcarpa x Juglans regia]
MAVQIMAQQHTMPNNASTNTSGNNTSHTQQGQLSKTMFHDFLGMKKPTDSPVGLTPKAAESPSASASLGASSGGGRGLISTTSDLGSERQAGNHLEGIPFYGPRSDISGHEISNRIVGSKRSNPDSAFLGSFRDGIINLDHDPLENSHLIKLLRNGTGGEQHRRSNDDEVFFGMHPLRPTSASLVFQPPTGSRTDANVSKWERPASMNVGPAVQYPPRGGQFGPILHQVPSNRFRDGTAGPSSISQSAADEGSRTGIKGPVVLSSINATSGASERNSSGVLPSGSRQKSGTNTLDPESSAPPSRLGSTSAGRQMTIFYGGQAHVFDDVHPNKADVIMALAGSNGGSWSTTYSKSLRPGGESNKPGGDNETGMAVNTPLSREFRGRLSASGISNHGVGSGDQISTPSGVHQYNIIAKDSSNPIQAAEPSPEAKREL